MSDFLRYITPEGDLISYQAEDGRTVIVEDGMTEFAALVAMTPAPFVPPAPLPITAADALASLAARRFDAEEAGTTFNNYPLATDRTTQAKMTAAYVKASADPDYTIAAWKFGPGVFVELDAETIIAAANAIDAHIQACFWHEAELSALILAAETPEALAAIDLDLGWPA